jgi:hypothetical protein
MPLEGGHCNPIQETFSLPQVDRLRWRCRARRIRSIPRHRPIQQSRSTIVSNPYPIEFDDGKRAVMESRMDFVGEIAKPSANRPPRLRVCQQRIESLTGHLLVRIPRQLASALPCQPVGPCGSPQRASHGGNRLGIRGGEPQPHRAPKPLVVSQGSAAVRLRAECVHEYVRSNPLGIGRKFERAGSRPRGSAHFSGGLQHRSCVTHPFVNPRKSIRPRAVEKAHRRMGRRP